MPETTANTLIRLRAQADALEQRSKHLLTLSVLFAGQKYYDEALLEARSLATEAAALRDQANSLEKPPAFSLWIQTGRLPKIHLP